MIQLVRNRRFLLLIFNLNRSNKYRLWKKFGTFNSRNPRLYVSFSFLLYLNQCINIHSSKNLTFPYDLKCLKKMLTRFIEISKLVTYICNIIMTPKITLLRYCFFYLYLLFLVELLHVPTCISYLSFIQINIKLNLFSWQLV